MTEFTTTLLPSGQDLIDRLRQVGNSGHTADRLHPIIVREIGGKEAGRKRNRPEAPGRFPPVRRG